MRIQHNIPAMSSYRNYTRNTNALSKNLEKLSSGYKINRAGDDAAGLAISEKMRAQITGLNAAQKNVKDGTSLVKTAEGAMQEIHDMLNRMDYLATQSANGTYDNEVDRLNLQKEVQSLKDEIDRIADSANFNGIKLLDGTQSSMNLSAEGVTYSTKSIVEGLTVNDGVDGGGTKGVAEIDVSDLFGTGDTLAVEFTDSTLGTSGTKTLTYGTDIKGATKEEQAESIKAALEKDAGISQKFDIAVDGSKVSITAKAEGASEAAVKSVKVNDKGVTVGTGTYTAGTANAAAAKAAKGGFEKLFDGGTTAKSLDAKAGDAFTFTFEDAQGNANLVAKVTVTDDMIGKTNEETTANIVNALNNTKFENKDGTVADESRFKVSDLFDLKANMKTADGTTAEVGSIYVGAKLDGQFDIASVARSNADDAGRAATVAATACTTAGTANVASTYAIARTDDATNFSSGDVIELTGSLSDGRNFNLKLTVGKDFQVGASYAATLTNMKTQLEKTGDDATMITLNDGSQVKDARDVTNRSNEAVVVDDLTDLDAVASKFADAINGVANKNLNADGSVPYTAVADGTTVKITTSEVGSDVKAMEITTPYGDEVPTVSFKFDPSKIKAGSYMTISDGKTSNTYEFVKTGEKPKSGNTAIEISDFN